MPADGGDPGRALRPGSTGVVRRVPGLLAVLCALAGFSPAPTEAGILFARQAAVPRVVQDFAWHVIETRCNYQSHERWQRRFWAHDARATASDTGMTYSIDILSDVSWRKTEPPAVIRMTVVHDGGVRLTALTSSFVTCAP